MPDSKGLAWFKGWQAGNKALLVGLRTGACPEPPPGDYAEWVGAMGEAGISLKPVFDALSGPLKAAFVAWAIMEFKQLLDDIGKPK